METVEKGLRNSDRNSWKNNRNGEERRDPNAEYKLLNSRWVRPDVGFGIRQSNQVDCGVNSARQTTNDVHCHFQPEIHPHSQIHPKSQQNHSTYHYRPTSQPTQLRCPLTIHHHSQPDSQARLAQNLTHPIPHLKSIQNTIIY